MAAARTTRNVGYQFWWRLEACWAVFFRKSTLVVTVMELGTGEGGADFFCRHWSFGIDDKDSVEKIRFGIDDAVVLMAADEEIREMTA